MWFNGNGKGLVPLCRDVYPWRVITAAGAPDRRISGLGTIDLRPRLELISVAIPACVAGRPPALALHAVTPTWLVRLAV